MPLLKYVVKARKKPEDSVSAATKTTPAVRFSDDGARGDKSTAEEVLPELPPKRSRIVHFDEASGGGSAGNIGNEGGEPFFRIDSFPLPPSTHVHQFKERESTINNYHLIDSDGIDYFERRQTTHLPRNHTVQRRSSSAAPAINPDGHLVSRGKLVGVMTSVPQPDWDSMHAQPAPFDGVAARHTVRDSQTTHRAQNGHEYSIPPPMDKEEEVVVFWPPLDYNQKPLRHPPPARNMRDEERIGEFDRQRRLELEAIRRREEWEVEMRHRQLRALQIRKEQYNAGGEDSEIQNSNQPQQLPTHYEPSLRPAASYQRHSPPPKHEHMAQASSPYLKIFEARPPFGDHPPVMGNGRRRRRVADNDLIKNEIVSSVDVLQRDRFEIDLLQRRNTFVEGPPSEVPIQRLGRRWKPPPEPPYKWPGFHDAEYRWTPTVRDPAYKYEENNFTPVSSPPDSPTYYLHSGVGGMSSLDEAARRQERHVIRPTPDGSHRPPPAFKAVRRSPAGGFRPHAPNTVRVKVGKKQREESGIVGGKDGMQSPNSPTVADEIASLAHTSTLTANGRDLPAKMGIVKHRIRSLEAPTRGKATPSPTLPYSNQLRVEVASPHREAVERIRTSSQNSPAPASYKRAKPYLPPPLPAGYRQSRSEKKAKERQLEDMRSNTPSSGNTKRMAERVQGQVAHHRHTRESLGAKLSNYPSPFTKRPTNGAVSCSADSGSFPQASPSTALPSNFSGTTTSTTTTTRNKRERERIIHVERSPYPYYK